MSEEREIFPFPGKVKSSVWEYFGFYKDEAGILMKSRSICKICRRGINYSGNTTNLRTHIVTHHKNVTALPDYNYSRAQLLRATLIPRDSENNFGASYTDANSPEVHMQFPSPKSQRQTNFEEAFNSNLNCTTTSLAKNTIQQNSSWVMEPANRLLDSSESSNKESHGLENSSGSFADSETESYGGMDAIQNAVLELIIHDLIPIEAVDSLRFKSLIRKGTRKNAVVPCSSDVLNLVLQTFTLMQTVCANDISKADQKCVKLELWKSVESSYLTVMIQALYENWKIKQYVVRTIELHEELDTKSIIEEVRERSFGIGLDKCVILSENNAILDAFKQTGNDVCLVALCKTVESCGQYCIQNSACKAMLSKVQNMVKFFNSNYVAKTVLHEKQEICHFAVNSLVSCNMKSWLSCLDMLETVLEQHNAITCSFLDQRLESFVHTYKLEAADFAIIQKLIGILNPLKTALRLTKDMRYPTAAVILPALRKLEISLQKNEHDSDNFVELRKNIVEMLKCHYEVMDVKKFLLQCSLLDPRFKCLKFVSQSDQDAAYEQLKQSAVKLKNQSAETDISESSPESSPRKLKVKVEVDEDYSDNQDTVFDLYLKTGAESASDAEDPQHPKRQKIMPKSSKSSKSATDDWFADVTMERKDGQSEENCVATEINRYKSELQISSTSSPLSWWGDREKLFPLLSVIAKQYVFVPAMLGNKDEVAEEWYKRQRISIPAHLVEPITFLHANYSRLKKLRDEF